MLDIKNQIDLDCNVVITVRESLGGAIVKRIRRRNLVVNTGRDLIAGLLKGSSVLYLTHLGIGTSSTAVAATQTALTAEVYRAAYTQTTLGTGQLKLKYFLASTTANGNTLREAGLFTNPAGGTMFARATHSAIAKTSSISITYEWTINIGAS